ncbi:MAG: hypothetical protein R3B48_28815 [Kofleriaceae bacterium]
MMEIAELGQSLLKFAGALDSIQVSWAIGGALASAVHGEPRSTNNVDVIAQLSDAQVRALVARLGDDFYASEDAAVDAVRRRASFNVIDNATLVKIDIFVPPPGPMGVGQLERARRVAVFAGLAAVPMLGPEDVVLQKLRWYRLGGEVSDRQWRDVVSVLRLLGERADRAYLEQVASGEGLGELLRRAQEDAGVDGG